MLIYFALVAGASVIAHSLGRNFWVTCILVAIGASTLNIVYELIAHGREIRPADALFWIPMLFGYGAGIAFGVAALIGGAMVAVRPRDGQ